MSETKIPKEIADLNFEDALTQLEKIVRDLEAGQVKLDEAVKHYERGALLKRHCENKLSDARMKIEQITGLDGAIKLESMESE